MSQNKDKIKVDIIKKVHFVAIDQEGNEYPLLKFNNRKDYKTADIEHSDVEGELITEIEQDRYEDGSWARSFTEITYFKAL